jgi:hypothetical protein
VANGVQRNFPMVGWCRWWQDGDASCFVKIAFLAFPGLSDCGNVIGTCPIRREKLPELRWSGSRYSGSSSGVHVFFCNCLGALSH